MYPYLSLVERKVADFYHNIDRRSWLVWVNMTYFHCFFRTIPGVLEKFPNWLFCHFLPLITTHHIASIKYWHQSDLLWKLCPSSRGNSSLSSSSIHLSSTNLLIFLKPNPKHRFEHSNWASLKTLPLPTWKLFCGKKVESFLQRHRGTQAQRQRGKRTHRHFSITSFLAQRWRWWGRGARQL